MKNVFFLICFLLYSLVMHSQENYVQNGSFENLEIRRKYQGKIKEVLSWYSPSKGTPDYFSNRIENKGVLYYDVPRNSFGEQQPFEGAHYGGFIIFSSSSFEYITNKLVSPLVKDSLYLITFYVSLAEISNFEMAFMNVAFSVEYVFYSTLNKIIYDNYLISNEIDNDFSKWSKVEFIYRAKGGEQFMTIGSFSINNQKEGRKVRANHKLQNIRRVSDIYYSYYYIDNVSLIQVSDSSECACYKRKEQAMIFSTEFIDSNIVEQRIIFENVEFASGSSNLLEVSYIELDKTIEFLKKHTQCFAEIYGHTDNVGDSLSNMHLSESRARSVFDYFIVNGVEKNRLKYSGLGDNEPLFPNNNEENRQKNRRVEIVFRCKD